MIKYQIINTLHKTNLNNKEHALLCELVQRADTEYKCFPTVGTLCADLKMSRTAYKYAMRSLVKMKLVKRVFRFSKITGDQRSNYFYLSKKLFQLTKEKIIAMINRAKKRLEQNREKEQLALSASNALMEQDISAVSEVQSNISNKLKKTIVSMCQLFPSTLTFYSRGVKNRPHNIQPLFFKKEKIKGYLHSFIFKE